MIIQFIIISIMLSITSYFDFKTRRIKSYIWVPFLITGLIIFDYSFTYDSIISIISSISITLASYSLYQNAMFGGADFRAISITNLLMPFNTHNYIMISTIIISLISVRILQKRASLRFPQIPYIPFLFISFIVSYEIFNVQK